MADTHTPTPIGDLIDTWMQQGKDRRRLADHLETIQQLAEEIEFYLDEAQHGNKTGDLNHTYRCLMVVAMHAQQLHETSEEACRGL